MQTVKLEDEEEEYVEETTRAIPKSREDGRLEGDERDIFNDFTQSMRSELLNHYTEYVHVHKKRSFCSWLFKTILRSIILLLPGLGTFAVGSIVLINFVSILRQTNDFQHAINVSLFLLGILSFVFCCISSLREHSYAVEIHPLYHTRLVFLNNKKINIVAVVEFVLYFVSIIVCIVSFESFNEACTDNPEECKLLWKLWYDIYFKH